MVVGHMPEGRAPDAVDAFQDRVARVRCARLDQVRERLRVAKAGATDAAGIDHEASVAKSDRARDMGMGAENKPLQNAFRLFLDRLQRGQPDRTVRLTTSLCK